MRNNVRNEVSERVHHVLSTRLHYIYEPEEFFNRHELIRDYKFYGTYKAKILRDHMDSLGYKYGTISRFRRNLKLHFNKEINGNKTVYLNVTKAVRYFKINSLND